MKQPDDTVPLRHMRDHAAEAAVLTQDRSREDLDKDRLFALGLTKLVENIGEAAARVSPETRSAHPNIPWKQIVSTRNRLVHGYNEVDFDILWRILSAELPSLLEQLEMILSGK